MKDKIIKLLEKHEDEIMRCTLGCVKDEYDEKYVKVYSPEWRDHKDSIALMFSKMFEYGHYNIDGMVWVILNEWGLCIHFNKRDLDYSGLINVCKNIIDDIKKEI